ncbi:MULTISPECIES: IclR family transcriptional regulator [unclassified Sporosarcina]|uniref:IclR family transcriptional regulator n=1 Tax=unclassified Sporosarcina TaxID=2647733 RepID=UPI000C168653|nr:MULTISPECIES: IclR family transcriptional regulator [unclassified Sporosarcina]PIC98581.1 IclR family transcriptional regulator [Sporosarcina sp. P29]PID06008.1 IclR family transcriptional regulator [Sporosarcina sp. P30]PID09202.1 IclR family transcriptional regulator [Sporosarcina sp. P31]PID12500.1 IclR family transcriptional regulator [Sporosarcina sp. P32b]
MSNKYWVPAIERADLLLREISKHPNELRLIDLSKRLEINKSSLYSLLNTLETLGWIIKTATDSYNLGPTLGTFNSMYLSQFNLIQSFYKEAQEAVSNIQEHIQLGTLEGNDVVYLGKVEAKTRVQLVTEPGMRFPAYASAVGKVQLINHTAEEIEDLFPIKTWDKKTEFTTSNIEELCSKVSLAKMKGYAVENQESALGFHCVAAPIYNFEKQIIAGISFTMPTNSWEDKFEAAKEEIIKLAANLSKLAGYQEVSKEATTL